MLETVYIPGGSALSWNAGTESYTAAPSDASGTGSDSQRQRRHASEPGDWLYGDKGNKFVACRGGAEDGGAARWPGPAPSHQAPGQEMARVPNTRHWLRLRIHYPCPLHPNVYSAAISRKMLWLH